MAERTTTGTVPSSGRGGTAAATAQNEQTAEEHSTPEQQPLGRLDHRLEKTGRNGSRGYTYLSIQTT